MPHRALWAAALCAAAMLLAMPAEARQRDLFASFVSAVGTAFGPPQKQVHRSRHAPAAAPATAYQAATAGTGEAEFAAFERAHAGGGTVRDLVVASARAEGVPEALAWAVARQESGGAAHPRRGAAGEYGTMQIKCASARSVGFTGACRDLADTATNIRWGVKYLAVAQRLAGGDRGGTRSRYNGGHATRRMIRGYCAAVARWLR